MVKILEEIKAERARQDLKWGVQTHPCTVGELPGAGGLKLTSADICREHKIPTEEEAKQQCDSFFEKNEGTYADIAIEEMCEAVSERDPERRRVELIQLAAVCVAWIESLDRQIADGTVKRKS